MGIIIVIAIIHIWFFGGVRKKKKGTKLALFIGLITAIAAVAASVTALMMYLDHKRDEEELEHYLDCSIQ